MTHLREWMEHHIRALYTHDDAGRIVRVNEPAGAPAPRFFLGLTADGPIRRYRADVGDDLRRALDTASEEPCADPEAEAPDRLQRYAAILARSAPIEQTWAGPAFYFPERLPEPGDGVILIGEANADLLRPLLAEWRPAVRHSAPVVAVVHEGRAVAVCASVRITPRAHEAGVETAPAFRGHGYAARVVAAWARAVRAQGAEPLYSTSWRNAASRAVARKLGLVHFGSDLHLT